MELVSVRMLIGEYPRLGYFFSIGAGRGHAGRLRLANLLATNGRGRGVRGCPGGVRGREWGVGKRERASLCVCACCAVLPWRAEQACSPPTSTPRRCIDLSSG